MKFRTEIHPSPLKKPIRGGEKLLAVGSCFSEQMAQRLKGLKLPVTSNPTGALFNPESIARAIDRWAEARPFVAEEFRNSEPDGRGCWFHYDLHGSLCESSLEKACETANRALETGAEALREADRLLVTFGTARIYELLESGEVVSNCHRQPAANFGCRRLKVNQIVERWSKLIEGPLCGKSILMTLSPIRHLSDGAAENSLSKATLRLAIAELEEQYPQVEYFPAYELLLDDLRDYRFYAEDMAHPSAQAVDYIWERFAEAALAPDLQALRPLLEALMRALSHRPLHPESDSYRAFCRKQLEQILSIERNHKVDLSTEKSIFREKLG